MSLNSWEQQRKCNQLTAEEADRLFFPGPGGKPQRADRFCSDCPVRSLCLEEALVYGFAGFWAGTTEDERNQMIKFKEGLKKVSLSDLGLVPPEPEPEVKTTKKAPRRRPKQPVPVTDTVDFLDRLNPSDDELLRGA